MFYVVNKYLNDLYVLSNKAVGPEKKKCKRKAYIYSGGQSILQNFSASTLQKQESRKSRKPFCENVIVFFLSNYAFLNTSYLTGSYIAFALKMESKPKNIIFSLKMMKSGLEMVFCYHNCSNVL